MNTTFGFSRVLVFMVLVGAITVVNFSVGILFGTKEAHAATAALVTSPYVYNFNSVGTLKEASSIGISTSPYWWVNSGAYLLAANGVGKTVQGNLPELDPWRVLYNANNPTDTDNGYHPQNIFRLVTRSKWQNYQETVYMRITKDNLSTSPNRNASNGLLLFNRYVDGNNLYYTGIRVDGAVVIKKKKNSSYYTLAYKKVLPGTYNRDTSPNLLPKNQWIGLRSEVINNPNGTVTIKFYTDIGRTGTWTLQAQATDNGSSYGGAAIKSSAYAGVRTDFMDVEFEDYKMINL